MERTLIILKPSAVQRGLIGEVTSRFERKGLKLAANKMMQLNDEILDVHYAHLINEPFFPNLKRSMQRCPVVIQCWVGVDAINVVRTLIGKTNGREALPGTIRGDLSISSQENIIHASDSAETAAIEIERFFNNNEIFEYDLITLPVLYSPSEV